MTAAEAETFLHAAHARKYFARFKCTVTTDGVVPVLGFAHGTPNRLDPGSRMTRLSGPNRALV